MAMATMNPATGGPVGGGMMMMNNGSPAVVGGMGNPDGMRQGLNTQIYDYLLKNGHYEAARVLVRDEKFDFQHGPKPSPGRRKDGEMNGDAGDGMDMEMKDDVPDDIIRPRGWEGSQGNGFLYEWYSIFTDLFSAHRNSAKVNGAMNPAAQYLIHEKNNQRIRENNINRPPMNNVMMQQMRAGAMNGKMPANMTPQQLQQMQQRKAQLMQQQMARGEQPDGEMNGVRPGSPGEGDAGGSPSKRPRIDNGQPGFQPGMMQNGRPGGVPGAPGQSMMIQAGFNPAMGQQFPRNGAMPPKGMQAGMQNGMMNIGTQGSPMMGGMNQFQEGMPMEMYNRPNMPGGQTMQAGGGAQSGNHALQDYQMQLMLLEQQNKKRLMMARQEQHSNDPGANGMPGVGMPPSGMSPSGSRTGTSPNPGEMKRTPGLGGMPGSPSAAEAMAAGRSPAPMNFNNMIQGSDFNAGMFMGKDQQMMGGGGPQPMRPPTSNEMNMRQQAGRPTQFQGGQPMQQQGSQTGQQMGAPGQRGDMPPPSAPPGAGNQQRQSGNSPSSQNQPPTPSQANKPNPTKKKAAAKDDNKRQRPTKKGSTANTGGDDNPTPQPSTPITPNNPGGIGSANKNQPGMQQANQHQPNQGMQMNQQLQQNDLGNFSFADSSNPGGDQGFNLDFSTLENADVLENFDFDSFLNTTGDDGFTTFSADIELGGDFSMGQGD